jgi:hypothetical protein
MEETKVFGNDTEEQPGAEQKESDKRDDGEEWV